MDKSHLKAPPKCQQILQNIVFLFFIFFIYQASMHLNRMFNFAVFLASVSGVVECVIQGHHGNIFTQLLKYFHLLSLVCCLQGKTHKLTIVLMNLDKEECIKKGFWIKK